MVFKLVPHSDGSWTESVLHSFNGGTDGANPQAGLTLDAAGNLYGTTYDGGANSYGTVFKLTPNPGGSWAESVLYSFCSLTNCADGAQPLVSLTFDAAGNLYGTTYAGGANGYGGAVFKLTPNPDGSWVESVLYSFCSLTNCVDGKWPLASLIFDHAGNLYGTTSDGGAYNGSNGTVFKLTPNADGSWSESLLYTFASRNHGPEAALIFDGAGNLYGTTTLGYQFGCGDVFELTTNPDGSWKLKVLYKFRCGKDGWLPLAGVIFDAVGNLYGTTARGGTSACYFGCGVIFRLAPNSKGGWNETVLHTFLDRPGATPYAGLISDADGNLYGTTSGDGSTTFGSVFEITP